MKLGWKQVVMDSLCSIKSGKSNAQDADENGQYVFFDRSKSIKRSTRYLFDCETLIIPGEGTEFLPRYFIGKFDLHQRAYALFDFSPNIDVRFLYYYLIYFKDWFVKVAVGATVKSLRLRHFQQLPVIVPPLPEQKRIVAILDKAFAAIATATANAEKNLANARELFESYLNNIFTQKGDHWSKYQLHELTTKIGSGATPRGGSKSYKEDGISLIRSLNVYDRFFKDRNLAFIDDEQADKLSNAIVENGDILFNITGASVARCCTVPQEVLPARVNQHVAILRPNSDRLCSKFLCYLLTSKPYKEHLLGIGDDGGSTRQAITKKQLQDLPIEVPMNLEEQNQIASKLDLYLLETQHLLSIYKKKMDSLAELKQSILQKAFRGELTADPKVTEHALMEVL